MPSILTAIKLLVDNPIITVQQQISGRNRANSVGNALESYVKDLFADSLNLNDSDKLNKHIDVFSYIGNQNNPPDIMFKGGDAIEIKKIQSITSDIKLNSSYPKDKLYADSPMITKACRQCEEWIEKDLLYVIGNTTDDEIKSLWFIYGDCFAADKEIYERIKTTIANGILEIPNVEFTETNELGKVKKVDPLGITDLRIRGMWHIQNPNKVFNYLNVIDMNSKFQFICLMKEDKYNSFITDEREELEKLTKSGFQISNVQIKNPNNPAKLMDCKLITYKEY